MLFFMRAMPEERNSKGTGPKESRKEASGGEPMTRGLDDKTKYEQLCTDFRALNAILWQMPVIFTTLTGGLWFAVASLDLTNHARSLILSFAALANLLMIGALIRLRYIMEKQRKKICELDHRDSPSFNFFTVGLMSLLLLLVAGGSWVASRDPAAWFVKAAAKATPPPTAPCPSPPVPQVTQTNPNVPPASGAGTASVEHKKRRRHG
jgi:hypothetical protein